MVMVAMICVASKYSTAIVMVKDAECKERDSGYLPGNQATSLSAVAHWADSACPSRTFSYSEVNSINAGAFCCKTSDDPGHVNPTWDIYQRVGGAKLESSASKYSTAIVMVKD